MDSDEIPTGQRRLIAVFERREQADQACDRLRGIGVPADHIVIDGPEDEVDSLRAEMREEVTKAWILPQASFIATKEGARGFVVTLVVVCAVALVIGVPLALIDFGFDFWIRLLIVEGIMLALAFVIALVLGPGLATTRPEVPMAAERGVTLQVRDDTAAVREALIGLQPIRVDEIGPRHEPVGTVMTEEDHGRSTSIAAEAVRGARDVVQNTKADDFHGPPGSPQRG